MASVVLLVTLLVVGKEAGLGSKKGQGMAHLSVQVLGLV